MKTYCWFFFIVQVEKRLRERREIAWLLLSSSSPVFLYGFPLTNSSCSQLAERPEKCSLQESAPCGAEQSTRQELDLRPNRMTGEKPLLISQQKGMCPDSENPKHLIQKFPSVLNISYPIVAYLHLCRTVLLVFSPLVRRLYRSTRKTQV